MTNDFIVFPQGIDTFWVCDKGFLDIFQGTPIFLNTNRGSD